jgi:hypothetical protein
MLDLEVMLALASTAASLSVINLCLNRYRRTGEDPYWLDELADD